VRYFVAASRRSHSVDVGLRVLVFESDPIVLAEDHVGAKAKVIGQLGIPIGTIFGKSFVEGGEEILEKGAAKKERYVVRENGDWRMKCRSETDARETEKAYENLHRPMKIYTSFSIFTFLLSLLRYSSHLQHFDCSVPEGRNTFI